MGYGQEMDFALVLLLQECNFEVLNFIFFLEMQHILKPYQLWFWLYMYAQSHAKL